MSGVHFRFEWIRSRLGDKDQVLDIGCAEGPLLQFLKGTLLEQNITPLDIDKHNLPRFIRLDAEDLVERDKSGLRDKSFDVAVLGDVLEHVKDPVNVLKGAWRVAKRLLITVPDPSNWHPSLDPYATQEDFLKKTGKSPEQHAKDSNPTALEIYDGDGYTHLYHRRWYTESTLRSDLSQAGFQDYKLERIQEGGWSFFVVEVPSPLAKPNESLTVAKQHPYTRGYFEGDGTGYVGFYRDFVRHWRMIKAIKEMKPSSVLDVGAGRGYICKHLEAELGIKAVAMDISEHAWHTRATDSFVLHDARKAPWPFKDKEFDLAVSLAFMEHLTEEEIPTVMEEMARVSNRAYLTTTFEKTPQDTDITHRTFKPLEWWLMKFKECAPDYPVEIMSPEEAKQMENTLIELPKPDGLVKLNIGSWADCFHYGWENWDIADLSKWAKEEGYVFRQVDITKGIPKPDNSVDIILASHLLEHLDRPQGQSFIKECFRVLKPDGVLRLAIPDSRIICRAYLERKFMEYRHFNIGVEKASDEAEALFHLLIAGHKTIYDFDSIKKILEQTEFTEVEQMPPFKSHSKAIEKQTISMYPSLSAYIEASPQKRNLIAPTELTNKTGDDGVPKTYKQYLAGEIEEGCERL